MHISAEQIPGPPVPALVTAAEDAELLVLGHLGPGGLTAAFAGSMAMTVMAQVRRPVVLVRAGWNIAHEQPPRAEEQPPDRAPHKDVGGQAPHKDVLLALDPHQGREELLGFAFDAAHRRGAPLSILYAWHLAHGQVGTHPARMELARQDAEWALAAMTGP
ncbi:universal stress protein [Streptomyces monticola]|uniref:Universal stress protein n=1 Tax=Streptomyces monticola TaxID=2666263 RepID=A0ABW2JRP1_9ACTN